jgi:hypothetical protein
LLRLQLLNAQQKLQPLGPPPKHLSRKEKAAWRDIIAAAPPGIYRWMDEPALSLASSAVSHCRSGDPGGWAMLAYRLLGDCFIPIRERRRLLFPDRPRRL